MAAMQSVQFDLFGGVDEAQTVTAVPPMLAAQRWQMPEAETFVAALRRGALNEAVAVLNRLKIDAAWKVLLETGFQVGGTASRAEMMAPAQRDIIEAARRRMTGHELRAAKVVAPEILGIVAERFGVPASVVAELASVAPEILVARFAADNEIIPNRMNPAEFERFPVGTARMADFGGDFRGRYVEHLREFDPATLVTAEAENGIKRSDTYARYLAWAKEGREAPYIAVYETDNGTLQSVNRRRTLVAQEVGKPIKGWFGPMNRETGNPLKYGDVLAAIQEAALAVSRRDMAQPVANAVGDEQEVRAPSFRYAMLNRPAGIGTVPKGFIRIEDRPAEGQAHYDYARHGVVVYDRRLTDAETKSFELAPMLDGDERAVVADSVAAVLGEYAEGYIEIASQDFEQFVQTVHERLRATAQGYPPSVGDMAAFAAMVRDRLTEHVVAHVPNENMADASEITSGWLQRESAGKYPVTPAAIAAAKRVVVDGWRARAAAAGKEQPADLDGACKFASLFCKLAFGGRIEGSWEHQYNVVDGNRLDLTELTKYAAVGHDKTFFGNREHVNSMRACLPRALEWVAALDAVLEQNRGVPGEERDSPETTAVMDEAIPSHDGIKHVEVFVPNERLGAFQRKLATMQAAARKLGLPEWDVTMAPKEWREVSALRSADDGRPVWEKMRQEGTPVTIEGRAPVVAGWRFLAKIEHEGDGNLVKMMGGDDQSAKSWHTCPPNCAHCNVPRQRNNTFMLQSVETGETKQVGSTCVSDFLGENYRDPERIAALYDHLADLGREYLYDPDREDGDVDMTTLGVSPVRVMATTLAIVEKDKGYISAEKGESEGVMSTGERVRAAFWSKHARDAVKVDIGHVERAGEVVDWLKGQTDAGSLWLRNIAFLANRENVSCKNASLFASGYVAWNRELQNSLKAARGTGDWIGQAKEKITVAATLERMGGYETQYGYTSVLTFRDEMGNALVWKTSAAPDGVVVGGNYHLMATVKDHGEYQNEKQTEIIRAKLPELELFTFGSAKSYAAMAAVATPDVVDDRGHTPLIMALWNDKVDHAKMLLANGADANQRMDGGLSALAYATSAEMANVLIGAGARAADVDEKDVEQMEAGAREVVRAAWGAAVEVEDEQKVLGGAIEARDNGRYVGAVVSVESGKVIQDTGRGMLVAHKLSDFANPPEVGAAIDIQYAGKVMKVVSEMGEGRGVGLGRL